ncbi:S8 family serine peptidase [Phormidium sp. FACHB-592]|uniref:S8 family serine peptidase n=1 Tax=Stenomitos frigidus AS-A4 TaxID=2933935 RepID=A0ABV0KMJ4_9CYAN|nr:S8 family serine peptidase [Phormidium sp. FACHB-592]MBD2077084.1 S8 family serine peptidase [Phormidium sp. FACHB-592]
MKRDSYSDQQAHASFQPQSPHSAIDRSQLGQPTQHSSSTNNVGSNWLNKASSWVADKFQTAQNVVAASGDAIAPDQILPALKGTASPNQPLVGVIDSGFGANEHGSKMVEAVQKENPQAQIWQGGGVGTGNWSESLVEFVDTAKAGGQSRAVANLSFDLTEVHPDGSTSTRMQLTAEEHSALAYARDNGVLVVASAGNQGGVMSALGEASQPSDNLIVVGAADGNDRASYSSYGNGLDLVANVGTAGTSEAAATVTGTIANIWSANPELNSQQVNQILTATATDLKTPGRDAETGAGLLNSTSAIDLATHTILESIVFSGAQLIQQEPESLAGATWENRNGAVASERSTGFGDWVHGALDVAGFIPGVGAVADVANAALYAAKGDYANAAMSAAAAVPGIGDAAAAVKLANRGVQAARAANRATRAPVPIRPRPSSPPNRPPTRPASSGASGRPASNPRPPQRQTVGASNPRPPQRQTGSASNPRPPQRQTVGASNPRQNANPQPHARGDRQPDRFSTRSQQERNQQIRESISETSMEALTSIAEQYAGEIPALQGVMDVVGLFGGRRGRAENPRGDRESVAVRGGNGGTRPSNPSTASATPGSTTRDRNSRADSSPAPRSGGSGGGNQPPRKPPTDGGGRPSGGYDDSDNNGLPARNDGNSGNSGSPSNQPGRADSVPTPQSGGGDAGSQPAQDLSTGGGGSPSLSGSKPNDSNTNRPLGQPSNFNETEEDTLHRPTNKLESDAAEKAKAARDSLKRTRKTLAKAEDNKKILSGWKKDPRRQHLVGQVESFMNKYEIEFQDSGAFDQGYGGKYKAAHAERMAFIEEWLRNPDKPVFAIGVNRKLCSDGDGGKKGPAAASCEAFFQDAANVTGKTIVIADYDKDGKKKDGKKRTWFFRPDPE